MVDLAKEAYLQNNYSLAAEIYQRNITDCGGERELYINWGNSLAHSLQFRKAFEAYRTAFRLENGHHGELDELVKALINMVKLRVDITAKPENDDVDMFSCDICKAILTDPVTISCGHSFCRKCLEKDRSNECKQCGKVPKNLKFRQKGIKTNVLLQKLIEEWFPKEIKVVLLKDDGNKHFLHSRFNECIEAYSEALKYGKFMINLAFEIYMYCKQNTRGTHCFALHKMVPSCVAPPKQGHRYEEKSEIEIEAFVIKC